MSNKKNKEFTSLYMPVHAQFERFCKARAYGQMDFKDMMQETIAIAFEKFETLQSHEVFLRFLFGISIRVLSNANQKIREEKWPANLDYASSGKNTAEHNLEIQELYKALEKLPDMQREALILFEISGFSIKEIAGIQSSSEDAVKQRLSRGRKELLELLSEKSNTIQTVEL
ncbi:MAG: RNA polymerase sigma factor [Crocinitomicaceae bacterium]|nr:RNA polymerase sigma factor [Crocinitomicaceae bacterium]NGF76233.1 RNA polymerase sigma factor [Fluviicola sp. SGL-29]